LADPRSAAWEIGLNAITDKPLLGYGMENFAVGFDKFYDPSIPNLSADVAWYDKAHNIIIQTGSDAGILGIIAYLALFAVLIWELQKVKNHNPSLVAHGIQATLIGYFITNLFGFDTFGTYIIFFLLIAYSLNLIYENNNAEPASAQKGYGVTKPALWKHATIFLMLCILFIFLWQYNLVPLKINAQINKANTLVNKKQCDQAFALMNKIMPEHSILDSYSRLKYVEFERTCSAFYPENNLAYTEKGMELLKEAVKIQPLYTRYWIFLGSLTTTLAEQQNDLAIKNKILLQADSYLDKALQLSPKHQEIVIAKARIQIDEKNYARAQDYSEQCINLYPGLGDCYWYLGLSEIYLKNNANAIKNIQTAKDKRYNASSELSLVDLANAYGSISDYQNLAPIFKSLVSISPHNPQYQYFLNLVNSKLGE
jgi:predicted Zn-dependent protease